MPKKTAQEAIASQEAEGKYSPESLRANMSTGGGTPIPKNHKWTNEHRVLQPRDPDTGHFTYNADAKLGLKYKSHGKADAEPVAMRSVNLKPGAIVKKGDVVNIGESTWIAIEEIDYEKVKDFFRRYDEERGEYYSYGQLPFKTTLEEGFEMISETVHDAKQLSDFFVKKQGRQSKSEKEGIAKGEAVVGHVDIEMVGEKTKKEISEKMDSLAKGFTPNLAEGVTTKISEEKLSANAAYNEMVDEKIKSAIGEAIKANPVPENLPKQEEKPAEPKQEKPAEQKPAEKKQGNAKAAKGDVFNEDGSFKEGSIHYYDNPDHKALFDEMVSDMKRDPAKYHLTEQQANSLNGEKLAYMANHGSLKGIKFKMK